jgi:hypothetical protein
MTLPSPTLPKESAVASPAARSEASEPRPVPIDERPHFFDSADRSLYAVHHAPELTLAGAPVVLQRHSLARRVIELWDGRVQDGTLDMPVQRRIVARVLHWIESPHPRPIPTDHR